MLLKNIGLASVIEGYTMTYSRAIKMFVSADQLSLLRRQLVALDHLDDHNIRRLTPAQRKMLDSKPEMLMTVTEEAPDPTKKVEKVESSLFGEYSDPKPSATATSKRSEIVKGQEVPQRERGKVKAEKVVKDDRVAVPSKHELVKGSDLLAIIIAGLKAKCNLETEDHVKAKVIGYLTYGPVHDDNIAVVRKIAEIYGKNRALW